MHSTLQQCDLVSQAPTLAKDNTQQCVQWRGAAREPDAATLCKLQRQWHAHKRIAGIDTYRLQQAQRFPISPDQNVLSVVE